MYTRLFRQYFILHRGMTTPPCVLLKYNCDFTTNLELKHFGGISGIFIVIGDL